MVDSATQDRLYPSGYKSVNIRLRRISVDSSLPYSVASNKRHNCSSQDKQSRKFNNENSFIDHLHHGLNKAVYFFNSSNNNQRSPKLLATYAQNINWPRSVCCLSETDGSLILCEQERCRLLLFSSQLMLRATCGGTRGKGPYEFDSPWSVAVLFNNLSSHVLVADTNNRRIQFFTFGYDGQFLYKHSLVTREKPYFIATNKQHFAVSCERGFVSTFVAKERTQIGYINLKRIFANSRQMAYCICMDPENSYLFVSNPIGLESVIEQLTITGEYLRSIKLDHQPFLHISALTYDSQNQQLVIADSLNSIIYSVEYHSDEDNVEILLKRSDNVNYPQALCVDKDGHIIVVECSVLTQHSLKIFRHHPCLCHSRKKASSVKTSETTSVRSITFQY